jgi:uncharacterized membrane protein YqjE
MALLQGLISLLGRSAGKILNAIFGWAVVGLFGRTTPSQQTLLSGMVAMAALWPLLLVGVAFPKVAALVIALVPLSGGVPPLIMRLVWIGLALAVPLIVGTVMASKTPPGLADESRLRRLLRGFPITLGIAAAFLLMFITIPVLRIVSAARGRKDEHVPCITDDDGYQVVARAVGEMLHRHGFDVALSEPSWWLSAPARVLQKMGGKALRGFMPDRLAYWKGSDLEIAFYPSDILIRGRRGHTAWVRGVLTEGLVRGPGLQTTDVAAQAIELQITRVWQVLDANPEAHVRSRVLESRLRDITRELGQLHADYDDWQVLYRQVIQLGRALDGEAQLLESLLPSTEAVMQGEKIDGANRSLTQASTRQLMRELFSKSSGLVKAEVALAKTELRTDLKRELKMTVWLGAAGLCAVLTLCLLVTGSVLALSTVVPAWAAALITAAVIGAIAVIVGLIGWSRRVRQLLAHTRKTLKEDMQWAKERLA